MKALVPALAVALSLFAFSAIANDMTGYISDDKCARDTPKVETDSHENCAKVCRAKGAGLVFVSDGRVYRLDESDQAKVNDYTGKKVVLSGQVDGESVKIDSVKLY